jgi:hypothetical protein
MKAFGLRQLIILFVQWSSEAKNKEAEETTPAPEN